jgi:hypothetical protein
MWITEYYRSIHQHVREAIITGAQFNIRTSYLPIIIRPGITVDSLVWREGGILLSVPKLHYELEVRGIDVRFQRKSFQIRARVFFCSTSSRPVLEPYPLVTTDFSRQQNCRVEKLTTHLHLVTRLSTPMHRDSTQTPTHKHSWRST